MNTSISDRRIIPHSLSVGMFCEFTGIGMGAADTATGVVAIVCPTAGTPVTFMVVSAVKLPLAVKVALNNTTLPTTFGQLLPKSNQPAGIRLSVEALLSPFVVSLRSAILPTLPCE